ncbi:hypothetical protein [Paraliobacillus sp. JSM ZJ581]|uniref:hypothetical protein n=1 Tax=Paraliobacillus sp. JSM ZJ581 TaxID=3342118 RepID=UPI0035A88511
MKMLVYVLLIAVIFLTGILLGTTNREFMVQAPKQEKIEVDDTKDVADPIMMDQEQRSDDNQKSTSKSNQEDISKNKPAIEKAALMIEETVIWVYDQAIQVAYNISEIFV